MQQEPWLKRHIEETQWHHSTLEPANRPQSKPFVPFKTAVGALTTLEECAKHASHLVNQVTRLERCSHRRRSRKLPPHPPSGQEDTLRTLSQSSSDTLTPKHPLGRDISSLVAR